MAVVGTAYVVIKAVTRGLERDIRRGVDRAVDRASPGVSQAGESLGESLSEGVANSVEQAAPSIGESLTNGMRGAVSDGSGDIGDDLVEGIRESVNRSSDQVGTQLTDGMRRTVERDSGGIGDDLADRISGAVERRSRGVGDTLVSGIAESINRNSDEAGVALVRGMRRSALNANPSIGDILSVEIEAASGDSGDAAGSTFTSRFGAAVTGALSGLGNRITNALEPDEAGNNAGGRIGRGIFNGLKNFPLPPLVAMAGIAVPLIGGAVKIASAYVAAATSLLAELGPAAAGGAAAGLASYTSMFQGIGFAMLALKAKTPILERFQQSIASLGPAWRGVAEEVQINFLPAVSNALTSLTSSYLPMLKEVGHDTGVVLRGLTMDALRMVETPLFKGRVREVMDANNVAFGNFGRAGLQVANMLVTVLAAAAPLTREFSRFVADSAARANAWLQDADAMGRLDDFMRRAGETLRQLGGIIGDVFVGIKNIFIAAAPTGSAFLDDISTAADKFRAWTESASGQNKLKEFFEQARPIVHEVNGLIGDLFRLLGEGMVGNTGGTLEFVKMLRTDVVPAIASMAQTLSNSGPGFAALVASFGDLLKNMADSGALGTFMGTLQLMFDLLSKILSLPFVGTMAAWAIGAASVWKALTIVPGAGAAFEAAGNLAGKAIKRGLAASVAEGALGAGGGGGMFASLLTRVRSGLSSVAGGIGRAFSSVTGGITRALSGVTGALGRAVGGIGRVLSGIGPRLVSSLGSIGPAITRALGSVFSGGLMSTIGRGVRAFAGVFRAVGPMLLNIARTVLPLLAAGIRAVGAAIMANPIGLIITAIAAVVAALIYAYNNFEPFRNFIDAIWEKIQQFFGWLGETLGPILSDLWTNLQQGFQWVMDNVVPILLQIWNDYLVPIGKFIGQVLVAYIQTLWTVWSTVFTAIWNVIKTVWDALYPIGEFIGRVIVGYLQFLWTFWSTVFQAIWAVIKTVWDALYPIGEWIARVVIGYLQFLWTFWTTVFQAIWAAIKTVWDILWQIGEFLIGTLIANIQAVWDLWTTAWNAISSAVSTAFDLIRGVIETMVAKIQEWWNTIWTTTQTLWNNVRDFVKGVWEAIMAKVIVIAGRIVAKVQEVWQKVTDWFDKIKDFVRNVWDKIWDKAENILGKIIDVVQSLWQKVGVVFEKIKGAGSAIWSAIASAARSAFDGLKGWINEWIIDKVNGLIAGINALPGPDIEFSIPRMAQGGIIPATPGGQLVIAGEAGRSERITPLDYRGMSAAERSILAELSRQNSLLQALAGTGARGPISVVVNNPRPEPASYSVPSIVRRLAAV